MPLPNRLEAYMFPSCPSVCPSVCRYVRDIFYPAITNEPFDAATWNCRNIFSISKWKAELFFRSRGSQDGRLSAMFIRNLYWFITLYWIEILTLIFLGFPILPQNIRICQKLLKAVQNGWKWPELAKNGHNIVLDWDNVFKLLLLDSRTYHKTSEVARNCLKWPRIAVNCQKRPDITGKSHNFVLDLDIDFIFFVWFQN